MFVCVFLFVCLYVYVGVCVRVCVCVCVCAFEYICLRIYVFDVVINLCVFIPRGNFFADIICFHFLFHYFHYYAPINLFSCYVYFM